MALSQSQIKELKEQLKSQVAHLPPAQKQAALEQIGSLSPKALELMLKQQSQKGNSNEKVFRLIIEGRIPSMKVDEDNFSLAVLEIKPISKGHTLVIPKSPAKSENQIKEEIKKFAQIVSQKLIKKLRANSAIIATEIKFGEAIINIIPVYDKQLTINSQRYEASEEELKSVISDLNVISLEKPKPEKIILTKGKPSQSEVLKLPRKIP